MYWNVPWSSIKHNRTVFYVIWSKFWDVDRYGCRYMYKNKIKLSTVDNFWEFTFSRIDLLKKYFCIGTMLIVIKKSGAKIFFCINFKSRRECGKN